MNNNNTIESRLARINALAEVLYDKVCGDQQAQILLEIILEASSTQTSKTAA